MPPPVPVIPDWMRPEQMPTLGGAGMGMGSAHSGLPRLGAETQNMGMAQIGVPSTAPGSSGGPIIDPKTGRMLRAPTTPAEVAQAEMEARNMALKNGASNTEAIINKGTEEITESEMEARRQAGQSAAAAGVSNRADMGGGMQRLGSRYAGMRANLARDVRVAQNQQAQDRDAAMFGRMFQYGRAARSDTDAERDREDSQNSLRQSGGGVMATFSRPAPKKQPPPQKIGLRGLGMGAGPTKRNVSGVIPNYAKKIGRSFGF